MSLLYQAAGFFTAGNIKMVQRSDVHYVSINITTNGLEFVGQIGRFPSLFKDSTGFRFDLPWVNIGSIVKSKERIMHVVKIKTKDNFYTILPLDPLHSGGLSLKSSKKNSIKLLESLNKAKAQIEQRKRNFCQNCGENLKPDSDFCGNCGQKLS